MQEEAEESEAECVTLSDDIMFGNILLRLPVKLLTSLKCVGKSWLSGISSPEFAKLHLKSFPSSSPQFLLFSEDDLHQPRFTSVTFNEHCCVEEIINFKCTFNGVPIRIVGCSGGLVCFSDLHLKFCLWNPVLSQYNVISGPNSPDYDRNNILTLGFGYISSIHDYRIACLLKSSGENGLCWVYIYSLKSREWKRMASCNIADEITFPRAYVPADFISDSRYSGPAFINDNLYWSALNTNLIIGVNLVDGKFSKIPIILSNLYRLNEAYAVKVFKMKGRLSCCTWLNSPSRGIWMLKRDGLSWMKLFHACYKVEYFTDTGKCLIQRRGQLMLLDPAQIFLNKFEGGTHLDFTVFSAWDYKMSLISPFGTNP